MSWSYNPKDASSVLAEGQYPATLESCTEKTSNQGNPMLALVFKVYPQSGGERTIYDYIVNPNTLFKLKGLAKALGRATEFEDGSFHPSNYLGANLDLFLTIQEDDTFGDKNQVGRYFPTSLQRTQLSAKPPAPTAKQVGTTRQKPQPVDQAVKEDDIPF